MSVASFCRATVVTCRAALTLILCFAVISISLPGQAEAGVPKKKQPRKVVLRRSPVPVSRPAARAQRIAPVELPPQPSAPPEPSEVTFHPSGYPVLDNLEALSYIDEARSFAVDRSGNKIYFTLNPGLQLKARSLLQRYSVPWGAIVALDPRTGRILALASYSSKEPAGPDVATRATFPAASLFKLVTASAAIERAGMTGSDVINFRGGNYTLERFNYLPDPLRDRRQISFADALGKSINPAFGRIGLTQLTSDTLERYALNFGFNNRLPFDGPIDVSHFGRPQDDYDKARTAAGFGAVTLSPLHAAVLTATIANHGLMMRPYVVDQIVAPDGTVRYHAQSSPVRNSIMSSTSKELLNMMQSTVETGTARRQFLQGHDAFLRSVNIAAKTGTLNGDNPRGTYHWFVAAVPAENPIVAIATLVIDPGGARVKSTMLGREILEYYFQNRSQTFETRSENVKPSKRS